MNPPIPILYEDNHILVVEKPPGLLSQADHTGDADVLTVMKAYIKVRDAKTGQVWLGLVHRLDRPTGGVMVLAKTSKAAARLSASIRDRQMVKTYLVLHLGTLLGALGAEMIWTDTLVKDTETFKSHVTSSAPDGRDAILAVTPLLSLRDGAFGLASCRLVTGRNHQIRVQFAARGCALVGDGKYGDATQRTRGLGLYAYHIEVPHPTRPVRVSCTTRPHGAPWTSFGAEISRVLPDPTVHLLQA